MLIGAMLIVSMVAPVMVARMGRGALALFALLPAATAVWTAMLLPTVLSAGPVEITWPFIPSLGLDLDLRLDALAALMCLVVSVLGVAVLLFSVRYFPAADDGLPKYAGSLLAFAASMLLLVLADNLLLLVTCWELTGLFSYLLIAHRVRKLFARRAASQAFIVTTAGGLCLLVGSVLLGVTAGTFEVSAIVADPPAGAAVSTAVVLMLIGGISKSAIVPFGFWLPGAMAAPTPASAYLHAATMVKAGIYLFVRLSPAFATLPWWRPSLVILGGATLISAGLVAMRQRDLKLLLAYSTVSQLGLMTLLIGSGLPGAVIAGTAVLVAHACFKGALFFVVGLVDTATGTRDMTQLSGVGRSLPGVATLAAAAAMSMAGLPPMLGFVAKEAGYAELFAGDALGVAAGVAMAVGSMVTVMYTARFWYGAFATKGDAPAATKPHTPAATKPHPPVPPRTMPVTRASSHWMLWPTVVLAGAGLVFGIWPNRLDGLLAAAVVDEGTRAGELALWHGFGWPLAATILATVAGAALCLLHWRWERRTGRVLAPVPEAGTVYRAVVAALDRFAVWLTAATQRGSLPVSLGGIAAVLVVFPGSVLMASSLAPGKVALTGSVTQAILVVVVAILALAVLRIRQAIAAVLTIGGIGYLIAVFYVLRGAPDLALTQLLVETVTLLAAVLILLRMPRTVLKQSASPRASKALRAGLAGGVGVVVAALALILPAQRHHLPAFGGRLTEVADRGGGTNVVNVILVDVRGWDTFGEISVLVAAAVGVSSLIFLRNPRNSPRRGAVLASGPDILPSPWLATNAIPRHSLILEVGTRLVFHLVIMFSLYVLFVGHNEPGGGFAAGLIAGIALALRYLAGGRYELGEAAPVDAGVVMGSGLVIAGGTAAAGLMVSEAALTSFTWQAQLPWLGEWSVTLSTVFDIGVYVVVIGMVLEVLRSMGAELDRQAYDSAREVRV